MDGMTAFGHDSLQQEIVARVGDQRIGTLRGIYGATFAEGFDDMPFLAQILADLDDQSMRRLVETL